MKNKKIYYRGNDEVGYLYLPNHPKVGGKPVNKQIKQKELTDLIYYKGSSVYFDFNEENELIGIEIVN